MSDLRRELRRKAFHMLSLVYLAAYLIVGYPRILAPLVIWLAIVSAGEAARLLSSRLGRILTALFGDLIRDSERRSVSGLFFTTAGVFAAIRIAGPHPRVVAAVLAWQAVGDSAAALVGKAWGRHRIFGGAKSWEGSGACFLSCLVIGLALRLGAGAAAGGALAAAAVELLPTTWFCNDNLLMPAIAASVVLAMGGAG